MVRLFRHYVPGSYLVLLVLESFVLLTAIPFGIQLSFLLDLGYGRPFDIEWLWPRSLLFVIVVASMMTTMGLYWRHRKESEWLDFSIRIIASLVISMMLFALIFYSYPAISVDRPSMFFALCYSLILISLIRLAHFQLSDHSALKRRILVIGTGKKARLIEMLRRKSDQYGIRIMGFVKIIGEKTRVTEDKVISELNSLRDYVLGNAIDEIVVAVDDRRKSFPVDEILECKMEGIDVIETSDFIERRTKKIKLDTLQPSSMIFSDGFSRAVSDTLGKRLFDIVVSILLLVLTSPVMILTAVSIWIESGFRGAIIYRQQRVGKNGECFDVLKFRSMKINAEQDGVAQWAQKDDDRVTKNGKIIRMLRIDELPQLFNVLKGEMSFVGPRPERPQFVEQLSQIIPFYHLRHRVKPGITGWAQISYPYGASEQDAIEKLQYDLYYIKRYSMMFDLVILTQTAQAVLWGGGAR